MGMIDISKKKATFRHAEATGSIKLSAKAFNSIVKKDNPKGDVLIIAEVAGINGVKNCSNLLPLCHPIPIEHIQFSFELDKQNSNIKITCNVATNSKTGVEMEALSGVQAALLCIYDMCKIIDPVITIGAVRLNWKLGGKKGEWRHPDFIKTDNENHSINTNSFSGYNVAVITLSDRAAKGVYKDRSGPALANLIRGMKGTCNDPIIIPDDAELLKETIYELLSNEHPDLIFTTGGTGISPRDITPETLQGIFDREIRGIGELLRTHGSQYTPLSWASRAVGGLIGKTIIIALPGSEAAVREGFESLETLLPHLLRIAKGEK